MNERPAWVATGEYGLAERYPLVQCQARVSFESKMRNGLKIKDFISNYPRAPIRCDAVSHY